MSKGKNRGVGAEISRRRRAKLIPQKILAQILGRSQPWLARVEGGYLAIGDAVAEKVFAVIERLASPNAADADFSGYRLSGRWEVPGFENQKIDGTGTEGKP